MYRYFDSKLKLVSSNMSLDFTHKPDEDLPQFTTVYNRCSITKGYITYDITIQSQINILLQDSHEIRFERLMFYSSFSKEISIHESVYNMILCK